MLRPNFSRACAWIAQNDSPDQMTAEEIEGTVTVGMVADLFGIPENQVVEAVLGFRLSERPMATSHQLDVQRV